MAVLRKIKAASLVETLIASVIIVVIFLIASLSINNVFKNIIENDDSQLNNRVRELTYLVKHQKIKLPYYEENSQLEISIEKKEGKVYLETFNKNDVKESSLEIYYETQ
jgi:hypothetical protein